MKSIKYVGLFGVAIWLILVATSLVLRVYETGDSPLFESLKFLVLAVSAVLFTTLYIRAVRSISGSEGALVGLSWAVIVIALDVVLYLFGLFNLSLGDYFKDVASSYLIFPIVGVIIGARLAAK